MSSRPISRSFAIPDSGMRRPPPSPPSCADWPSPRSPCSGPSRDLHSGLYGGPALNPLRVLAEILAGLHDGDGRVAIPGFYDGIRGPSPAELASWRALGFDEAGFLGGVGLSDARRRERPRRARAALVAADRRDQRHHRRLWRTGHQDGDPGGGDRKAFLPPRPRAGAGEGPRRASTASSRIACPRMRRPRTRMRADRLPSVSTRARRPSSRPRARSKTSGARRPRSSAAAPRSRSSSRSARGSAWTRFSIGFALDDDRIHAPNEKYNLTSFTKGMRSWARILAALGALD